MIKNTNIVILAAGKGTRMGGDVPKALTNLSGRPMIDYVIGTALESSSERPITVVGYKSDMIREFAGDRSLYVEQLEQKGTGHAVSMSIPALSELADTVVVLYADQPFVSSETINELVSIQQNQNSPLVIATAVIKDENLFHNQFYNFGRIIRNADGEIQEIIEKKDATDEQLAIREVNPAYFCMDKKWMIECLGKLENNNAQGEFYLTDLVGMAFEQGLKIPSVQINEKEALGANTPEQLSVLESFLKK